MLLVPLPGGMPVRVLALPAVVALVAEVAVSAVWAARPLAGPSLPSVQTLPVCVTMLVPSKPM
jgi:hypothetical protein